MPLSFIIHTNHRLNRAKLTLHCKRNVTLARKGKTEQRKRVPHLFGVTSNPTIRAESVSGSL
jgi:hypothetical protein